MACGSEDVAFGEELSLVASINVERKHMREEIYAPVGNNAGNFNLNFCW